MHFAGDSYSRGCCGLNIQIFFQGSDIFGKRFFAFVADGACALFRIIFLFHDCGVNKFVLLTKIFFDFFNYSEKIGFATLTLYNMRGLYQYEDTIPH